jgi:hypothetical protein
VDGLSDDELLEQWDRLKDVVRDPVALAAVVRAFLSQAHRVRVGDEREGKGAR